MITFDEIERRWENKFVTFIEISMHYREGTGESHQKNSPLVKIVGIPFKIPTGPKIWKGRLKLQKFSKFPGCLAVTSTNAQELKREDFIHVVQFEIIWYIHSPNAFYTYLYYNLLHTYIVRIIYRTDRSRYKLCMGRKTLFAIYF
jgi:hypothetical protein